MIQYVGVVGAANNPLYVAAVGSASGLPPEEALRCALARPKRGAR